MTVFHRGVWLHRYAIVLSVATFFLIIAGGLVTSTGSGLAVPDWPLSFGQIFPRMEGGVLFEHGHRLVASLVGLLAVGFALLAWRLESRAWVRRLAWVMVAVVILQGLLGGLTVLMRLPDAVSIAHAGLAQVFFALTVVAATATGVGFRVSGVGDLREPEPPVPDTGHPKPDTRFTLKLSIVTATAVYLQILLGAIVRHTGAGMAIPTFPLAHGRVIPEFTSYLVGWQFAHRAFALVVAALVIWTAARILARHRHERYLTRPAAALIALVIFQILLGGLTIWTIRAVTPTTAHVACGALLWVTAVMLSVRAHAPRRATPVPAEPSMREGAAR